ncbi:Bug family tripartite tricarboxylate transporter substrate binding protein [Ramlibacter albus]|uniref:Tripartite tricarboxylate transporter substrate binding protein n=1 Tax=Ramlibacter albus TaxID=2079448 RepID=A0A923M895_9BURK|nr:tripartite tricarboxylate transporter substrate binding protein [Ramlibacter albus]MBC5764549.1 tripartite tricarboxylate transporter substrate binding protein [Ramlibacter albus]
MQFTRRTLTLALSLATCAAALGIAAPAFAQSKYPAKPVKFVVPFAPGGGSDTFSRLVAQKLTEQHGYTVVIDNKPGAGGNLGAEAALREPADGYTFLVISGSYAGNAIVNKPSFDPIGAIVPVVQFTREAMVLAVGPNTPYKTLQEFIADAKKDPSKISYGSSGTAGLAHLATEYFNYQAGIQITHVPYKGTGAALVDLAGGQIQMMLGGTSSFASLAKSGKVRMLAVGAPQRLASFPNLPTFAEQGLPNYRADLWHGLVAAKGTPPEIIAKVNADINAVLKSPEMQARFAQDDVGVAGGTPQQFAETIKEDMERWRNVIKQANIKIN